MRQRRRMRLYLDVCCVNRPSDDQSRDRIRLETEAVLLVLDRVRDGSWEWIGSDVMGFELSRDPNADRRAKAKALTRLAARSIPLGGAQVVRGETLQSLGFRSLDALHLACAEEARVDVF